jgi:hypothetical protein
MSGQLEKLIITSFKDVKQTDKLGEYTATINPDQIVVESKIEYEPTETGGGSAGQKVFKGIASPKLTLKLLIDGTGIVPSAKLSQLSASTLQASAIGATADSEALSSVNQQIDAFKKVAAKYVGESHDIPNIQIAWGELLFVGKMESMKISYTLFKPDGSPIRAIVDAVFEGSIDVETRKKEENNSSPDLTHIRVVNEGDTLPIMCNRIYKNPNFYLEIARVNNLSNYRKLNVGEKLFFPPLKDKV